MRLRLKGDTAAHNLPAVGGFQDSIHLYGQAKPVQQLRPQVALFRVHSAHQNKLGGVTYRHTFALNVVPAHGRRIQQHVDQVVIE